MAEAVGFEPTCPCGQLHFECSSLQPLRYASMYKYSLFGANHMISSRSRYDHFDTSPYLSQHQHLRKRGELMGRTKKNIQLKIPEKPRKIKGFRSGSYRMATTISSQCQEARWFQNFRKVYYSKNRSCGVSYIAILMRHTKKILATSTVRFDLLERIKKIG